MSFLKRLLKRLLRRLLIGGTAGLLVVVLLDILAYPLYHQEPTSLNWFEQTLIKVDYQAAALQEDIVTYLVIAVQDGIRLMIAVCLSLTLVETVVIKRKG
ncbi:MAG: hypothetical protein F6K26_18875 [Moorea sp. SIO2I5]|nr:hypothetical protein [Moorena sp. SIO2I5]